MYATDTFEIVVRSEKRISGQNIIKVLTSGDPVEVTSLDNEWAAVTLPDGRTGYVKTLLLVDREPYRVTNDRLQSEVEKQRQRFETLQQELTSLREAHKQLQRASSTQATQLTTVNQQYTQLRQGASEFLQLQADHTTLQQQHHELQEKFASVSEGYASLKKSRNLMWFLSGAGVILVGMLLGIAFDRRRGRRRQGSYSYQLPL
jgi:SH3 domain protein